MEKINHNQFESILPKTAIARKNICSGVIVRVKLLPKYQNKILSGVSLIFPTLFVKDYFFWLPYKNKVNPDNYGIIGSRKRKNYSNVWFFIKPNNPLYSLSKDSFRYLLLRKSSDYVRANIKISFFPSDLVKVTSKSLKKELDKILTIK